MARKKTTVNITTFRGGLVTEAPLLAFPEDAAINLLNCDVLPTAEVVRRLGVDYEPSFALSTATFTDDQVETMAITTNEWKAVAGDGLRQFLLIQMGSTVFFYDQSAVPLSGGLKSFSINLDSFLAPAATDASTEGIEAVSGRGFLFIVSSAITPLKVSYDASTDNITTSAITFEIRDVVGLDDGLDVDEEPTSLSKEHHYNLKNQGWVSSSYNPITTFFSAASVYPSNSQVPWTAVNDTTNRVDTTKLRNLQITTTAAARGRYIVDPFFVDRSSVSGVAGITSETTNTRPSTIAFFSGRVAYAGMTDGLSGGDIFISQVIDARATNAGACYQVGDPTSEDDPALVASDGLVVPIPEASGIVALRSLGAALLVLADNGVWSISGAEGAGFKATGFTVSRVAGIEAGCLSRDSVIDLAGAPSWWAKTGIYGAQIDDVTLQPKVGSLTDSTVKTFYQDIDDVSKTNVKGIFDPIERKAYWFYKDTTTAPATSSRHYYERVLVLNTLTGAFMPHTITPLAASSPFICGAYGVPQVRNVLGTDNVTENGNLVTENGNQVTVTTSTGVRNTLLTGFLMMKPDAATTNNSFTFGHFLNPKFLDWEQADTVGVDYTSFLEVGYYTLGEAAKDKQAPYLVTFLKRTETGFEADPLGGPGFVFLNPSSCKASARWEWTDSANSNRWTTPEQVYKFDRLWTVDPATLDFDNGFPVVSSKIVLPGKGKSLKVRYESEAGFDFKIIGWTIAYEGVTDV